MEDKPPAHDSDVPRSRTPRATFSASEKSSPPSTPAEHTPRHAAKAPPVTFQPPTVDEADQPRKTPSGTAAPAPTATPGPDQSRQPARSPRKSAPRKTTAAAKSTPAPAKAPPSKPAPAKSTPAKTAPAKTAPAKPTPAKSTPAKVTPAEKPPTDAVEETATPPAPAKRAARRATRPPASPPAKIVTPTDLEPPAKAEPPAEAEASTKVTPPADLNAPTEVTPPAQAEASTKVAPPAQAEASTKVAPPTDLKTPTEVTPPTQAKAPTNVTPPAEVDAPATIEPPVVKAPANAETPAGEAQVEVEPPTEAPTPSELEKPVKIDTPAELKTPTDLQKPAPDRTEAWAKLVADPGHAPELLALAAVQTIGPRAQLWVDRIHEQYPTATDHAVARLAIQQFTRLGSVSGMFGAVAGSYAPIALLGAGALTHAELILHVAAAYGRDPAAEERAADLLVLTRVHPDRDAAQAALAAAKQPAYEEDTKITDAVWRFGRMAIAQAGGWTAIRLTNRFFPGTSLLAATLASRSSAETVAARARALYSQESHALGNTV